MKVSIQIPSYNQEYCIERAIRSALAQDYGDLEVIVCDDNSTDQTYQKAISINDPRLKVYRNEKNLGRVENYRHLLHDLIGGEWYVNLDGDDYFIDNRFISKAIECLKLTLNPVLYQACTKAVSERNEYHFQHKLIRSGKQLSMKGVDYFQYFNENEFFGHLSSVVNVAVAKKIGAYESDSLFTDAEALLKVALHGQVILDNVIAGIWSIHPSNESNKILSENYKTIDALRRLREYSVSFIGEKNADIWLRKSLKRNIRSYYSLLAKNDFKKFLTTFFESGNEITYWLKIFIKNLPRVFSYANSKMES